MAEPSVVEYLEQIPVKKFEPRKKEKTGRDGLRKASSTLDFLRRTSRSSSVFSRTMSGGIDLAFREVGVNINGTQILNNVSGLAKQGDMLAIMGPSGAGKSTLLNCLSCRRPISSGSVTLNGLPVNNKLRRKICYVLQEDILFPNLTCKETLQFAAKLKMPRKMPKELVEKRVDDMIKILGLGKCQNTLVGSALELTGLSGGEKKRTNIACELLTNPSLLVLDEPTSGLDSAIAYNLMKVLKIYTQQTKKTVVTTIHQPSSQIFYMFNNILLMCDGQVAYFGKATKIMDFFNSTGLYSKLDYNPADFILEKVKESEDTTKKILSASLAMRKTEEWPIELRPETDITDQALYSGDSQSDDVKAKDSKNYDQFDLEKYIDEGSKWQASFWTQFTTLLKRGSILTRDRALSRYTTTQTMALGIIVGLLWFNLPRTEDTYLDRMGVLFFVNTFMGILPVVDILSSFQSEKEVITKEREAGTYRLSAYYLSKMTSEAPFVLILPTTFVIIVYWMTNLTREADNFFWFWLTAILIVLSSQSIGLFIGIINPDYKTAHTMAVIVMLIAFLAGGFYAKHMPDWIAWVKYLSITYYTYGAMLKIEFRYGQPFQCSPLATTQFPTCIANNGTGTVEGDEILKFIQQDQHIGIDFAGILSILMFCRVAGYLYMRFFMKPGRK